MSWRSGSSLFMELWPIVAKHINDAEMRKEFGKELMQLFLERDVDPADFEEFDPEVDEMLDEYFNDFT
jgi:hypothetical protein